MFSISLKDILPWPLASLVCALAFATSTHATGFISQSIGSPNPTGTFTPVTGGVDITVGGTDIGGTTDQFAFNYQTLTGDFDVKVRVSSLSLADAWSKGGLMARETTN